MKVSNVARLKVLVITHFTSPYQVELFDSICATTDVDVAVIYLNRQSPGRKWAQRKISHTHLFASDLEVGKDLYGLVSKADLIVINFYQSRISFAAISLSRELKRPIVFWGERPHEHKYSWISKKIRSLIFIGWKKVVMDVWGIGGLAVDKYKIEFGKDCQYTNVPYFSDLSRFAQTNRRNGFDPMRMRDTVTFLYSGSLIHRKGVDVLARAFLKLLADGQKARLVFLGEGDLRPELETMLRGHEALVEFLGFKDWEELPGVYASADVLCVPSRHDGWALVVPEGLAAGLPVIATTTTGAAVDLIKHGINGWLVPCDDVVALASAMSDAATLRPDILEAMSVHAEESVVNHQLQDGAAQFAAAAKSATKRYRQIAGQ